MPDPTTALLLDVMGTLVYEPFFVEVPRALGMSLEALLAAKHPTAWLEFERGEIDEDTFRSRFFTDGRDYPHERMRAAMVDAYRLLDGIEALLDDLAAAGPAMHLLSNYPTWYRLIEDKLKLSRWAKWSFVSCEMGVRKPDREIFRRAAAALEAAPEELLFVDDREANCHAARAFGMRAIRFEDAEQLRRELARAGVV